MDVGGLIVRHTGAHRIGQGHAAVTVNRQQARHAQHGVGVKYQWVDVVVVYASINDVDLLRALGGAHVDRVIAHE